MQQLLKQFGSSLIITLAVVAGVLLSLGAAAAVTTLILIAIELAFSFDNAIVNAKVLAGLSRLWQQLFLTIGLVLAIVGMRVIFPVLLVAVTAHLPFGQVVDLALHKPHEDGLRLDMAHPAISGFGGAFLLVLTLYFFFDAKRETLWLKRVERPLQALGKRWWMPAFIALGVVGLCAVLPINPHPQQTLQAGVLGVLLYVVLEAFIGLLGKLTDNNQASLHKGWAAFGVFMYLQVLDASFSFDGVVGAFAITNRIVLIAAGLGVGALWVRSLTVYMVQQGTLEAYKYLEHGAHYAIGSLGVLLLASEFYEVPDAVTGLLGIFIIAASLFASIHENKLAAETFP